MPITRATCSSLTTPLLPSLARLMRRSLMRLTPSRMCSGSRTTRPCSATQRDTACKHETCGVTAVYAITPGFIDPESSQQRQQPLNSLSMALSQTKRDESSGLPFCRVAACAPAPMQLLSWHTHKHCKSPVAARGGWQKICMNRQEAAHVADPPVGIGGEFEAAVRLKLVHGLAKAHEALLDQVLQLYATMAVVLGHAYYQAYIVLRQQAPRFHSIFPHQL